MARLKALLTVVTFSAALFGPSTIALAHATAGGATEGHTAVEEAEGKALWDRFQAKQIGCRDLKEGDFGALGEYFMGQMMGITHEAMNNMMIQMMGESGEEQMHIAMGKRLSGCDMSAAFPAVGWGMMPMMQMMGFGQWNNMTGWNSGAFGWSGVIVMLLWWAIVIAAVVLFVKWIAGRGGVKSAREILEERYARGEIDRREFEEKKKDLGR